MNSHDARPVHGEPRYDGRDEQLTYAEQETGGVRCRTDGGWCKPAVGLIDGEPRCPMCISVIRERLDVDVQPLPGTEAIATHA